MQTPLLDQPLPHSSEAERIVLGAMMLDANAALEAMTLLAATDFYLRSHQMIYAAYRAVLETGEELTPVIVAERLRADGMLEAAGGIIYLSELTTGLPLNLNLRSYAALLREKATARKGIRLSHKIASELMEGDGAPADVIARAEDALSYLATKADGQRPRTLADRGEEHAGRYELFFRGVTDAIATGFDEIDTRLTGGGLRPAQLVILAARPSMGKSALALDIAANVAAAGGRVVFYSLEMSAGQLCDRLVSFEAGLERWKLRPGLYESDYRRASAALEAVNHLPIYLDDTSRSITEVRAHTRTLARRPETRPALVVVDYLQLIEAERRGGNRNNDVGSVSRALKGLAMELKVPVLALCQLSRDCDRGTRREPELMDLRDSGELEQDADIVLMLFGDKPAEDEPYYDRTLKCAKQRDGATWRVELPFNGPLVSYRRLTMPEPEQENVTW